MKNHKNYGRVMISDTIYNLLIYFLISTKEEIDDTFFFFSNRIPRSIGRNLNSHYISRNRYKFGLRNIVSIYTRITRLYRWPFLKSAEIFGLDHIFITPPLVGNRGMTIIEDGTSNYGKKIASQLLRQKGKLKMLLYGPRIDQPRFGASTWDKKVILTGLGEIPENIKPKADIIDLKALWNMKSQEFKEWILNLYGLSNEKIEMLKSKKSLLLIQSLELYGVPESVVIETYKDMVKDVDHNSLIIKSHPASTIDYRKHFPDAYIFEELVPMELLTFTGCLFEDVYTVSTTAVFSMPKSTKIHFSGTTIHPLIEKALGSIQYSDFIKER